MSKEEEVYVYSVGICYASACAPLAMSAQEVAAAVNVTNPTGVRTPWQVSEENFSDGGANPHLCEVCPTFKHWLLSC